MTRLGALMAALLAAAPVAAQDRSGRAGEPLSAIDWLSDSVELPSPGGSGAEAAAAPADEPPATEDATTPTVTVQTLGAPTPDTVGLLPTSTTGLPQDLWSGSEQQTVADLVRAEHVESTPAIRDLLLTLLLAEARPPSDGNGEGELFLARIDRLLDLGALDPALEMLEAAEPDTGELFRRYFDVALLTGAEDRACKLMEDTPHVAPTLAARIFCLARGGDWSAAALTLLSARALDEVDAQEEALLQRFLDPGTFEGLPPLESPERPSPLVFRMREAIGEPLSTSDLPRAFAQADLRGTVGWKAQLEAGERLARSGALPENRLLGLYTKREPAASGGVWDRASAIQRLDQALVADDVEEVSAALPAAWEAMAEARLEVPFAQLFAPRLEGLDLDSDAGALAFRLALLSKEFEAAALSREPQTPREEFLAALARGEATNEVPDGRFAEPVARAFGDDAPKPPEQLMQLAGEQRLGEALLRAMTLYERGAAGDPVALTDALVFLRRMGLEETARRAALQLMILERDT